MTASDKPLRLAASTLAPWAIATILSVQAGTLTGVILDDVREPVPGVQVHLEQVGGESGPWTTVTGPDGRFAVSDPLLFGNIRVTPTKPGIQFTPAVRDLFFDFTGTADFSVDVPLFPVVGWRGWFNFIERTADLGSLDNRNRSVLFGPGPADQTIISDSGDGFGQRAFASGWQGGAGTKSWRFEFSSDLRVWKTAGALEETQPGEYVLRESSRLAPALFIRPRP